MASSNRHWPSMFKRSKPSNGPHHNDINSSLMSTGFQRTTPYTSGGDEKSPEPKPRWNPKPEQIRILEAIFNSGMVNPPRDEIRKIRTQLQEYGQVGDANVFYWFQNRKSRSKHKLRHLQKIKAQQNSASPQLPDQITPPSSSSSSDKSPPQEIISLPNSHKGFSNIVNNIGVGVPMPNSPTASVNQTYFQTQSFQLTPAPAETFPYPMLQHMNGDQGAVANNNANITTSTTQGFYLSEFSNMIQPQQNAVPSTLNMNNIMHNQDPQLGFCLTSTTTDPTSVPPITVPPLTTQLQGVGEVADGTAKNILVFINNEPFEVAMGPFNVREALGDGVVLFHSSGQPVLTDEWGITLHSLQHAASYYFFTWWYVKLNKRDREAGFRDIC